jgi:DNA-binding response OmpR family regulator
VQLPDIDGVEALGHLRANRRTASIPVLALTAQAMHGDRERFLAAGFDRYIAKPVDIVALVHTVHELRLTRRPVRDLRHNRASQVSPQPVPNFDGQKALAHLHAEPKPPETGRLSQRRLRGCDTRGDGP